MRTTPGFSRPVTFLVVTLSLLTPDFLLAGQILALRTLNQNPFEFDSATDGEGRGDFPSGRPPPVPIVPAATVSEAPGPVAIAGGDEGFLLPRGNAVLVPERAERVPGAFQDDDNGPGVSQDLGSRMVVKPSVLRVSEIEFSTLVVSTMDLSVMAGPAPTYYTPMSTAAITPPGSANYHSFGGGAGSFDPPDPDREEEGRVTKVYYIKPIGGVIGTALLFLVIGLVFLRSHREGDAY